jgi:hypothetical protein
MTDVPGPAAVLRAMGRARERDDFEAALLFIAPESLDQGERVTRQDWRRKWESMRDASPDLEIVTEQSVAEASGSPTATCYAARTRATSSASRPPVPPSRPVAWTWSGSLTASWSNTGPSPGRCGRASGGRGAGRPGRGGRSRRPGQRGLPR